MAKPPIHWKYTRTYYLFIILLIDLGVNTQPFIWFGREHIQYDNVLPDVFHKSKTVLTSHLPHVMNVQFVYS